MKNTLLSKSQLDLLPFNQDDIITIFSSLGYHQDNLSRDKDTTRILIEMGCNFVEEIIDYCKMMRITGGIKKEHVEAAMRMKIGRMTGLEKIDGRIQREKGKGLEIWKIDEKYTSK